LNLSLLSQLKTGKNDISGKIFDSETNNPVPFAIVFLKNTAIGTSANSEGYFHLKDIPTGEYEIIFSQAGYLLKDEKVSLSIGEFKEFAIFLTPKVVTVNEVEVFGHTSKEWKKNLGIFTEQFLGSTRNSRDCSILNPEVIDFINDPKTDILEAKTDSIIIIENRALGYKIHLRLAKFTYDINKQRVYYYIYPRFEELLSNNPNEMNEWNKSRKACYYFSLTGFLKSILGKNKENESCLIYGGKSIENLKNRFCDEIPKESINILPISGKNFFEISFGTSFIKITFLPKVINNRYYGRLFSLLELPDNKITVSGNGEPVDPDKILIHGFWGTLRLADTLPIEYENEENKK
jgi:hypothetical protein